MKVLHVAYSSQPDSTGASIRTRYIVETQARLGIEPVVLSSPFQRPVSPDCAQSRERLNGIWHYRCFNHRDYGEFMAADKPLATRSRKLLELLPFAAKIRHIAKVERVDVIHAHNNFFCGLAAALAARSLGLPSVYEVRSLTEECLLDQGATGRRGLIYAGYRAFDALTFGLSSHITAISEGLRQDLVRRRVPASRITVAGNGVDADRIQPSVRCRNPKLMQQLRLPGDVFVLGYIGTLFSYESLDLLLEAVSLLKTRMPDLYLIFVGDGEAMGRLKSMSEKIGVEDRVRFVGSVPHDEVAKYYELVDLFVLPRRRTRLTDLVTPLKPLEIMARAKPVLASDCGGHRELVVEGVNGYLFDPSCPDTLAARIEELSGQPEALVEIGRKARAWVQANRSWDAMLRPTVALYSHLTKARPATRTDMGGRALQQ
jgi:glycogen(starch) synthase